MSEAIDIAKIQKDIEQLRRDYNAMDGAYQIVVETNTLLKEVINLLKGTGSHDIGLINRVVILERSSLSKEDAEQVMGRIMALEKTSVSKPTAVWMAATAGLAGAAMAFISWLWPNHH